MLFQTDNNGNAMLQSFLPILSGNKSDEDTRTEKTGGGKCLFFNVICSRGCTRRNLCFQFENCQHADQTRLTRRKGFGLDIESTRGKPASRRARPVNIDDSVEGIR